MRIGSLSPSFLGSNDRSACHTPIGGDVTLRTPSSVSIHEQARVQVSWPKPYPPGATPSLTSDFRPSSPSRRKSVSFSSDRVLSSGPRGSFPERDRMVRPTGACNLQYPFLKDDRSRLVSLRTSFPHWVRGFPSSTLGDPLRRALPSRSRPFRPRPRWRTVPLPLRRRPRDRTRFRADTRDQPRPFYIRLRVDVVRPSRSTGASTRYRRPFTDLFPLSRTPSG